MTPASLEIGDRVTVLDLGDPRDPILIAGVVLSRDEENVQVRPVDLATGAFGAARTFPRCARYVVERA